MVPDHEVGEHKRGVVQKIDESSRQLAEALESAVPVIITTLQKFPFVSQQLLKMAEERGADNSDTLPTRRCAVEVRRWPATRCARSSRRRARGWRRGA